MNPLVTAITLIALILAVHFVIAKVMQRPLAWYGAATFGIGFAIAYLINDHFQNTGIVKYLVLIALALPFFYLGQFLQQRNRPAA